ncbi:MULTISPECIES: VWA domain-containing protein [Acidobacteriaceae]|uniref:VWA domain-containing protein n=1 Tax=Acidobacteriaceae TaxID=204434 RepID=UPI00131B9DCB|nr:MULTISPECIES: VWA domain-containing protein [Acidobacteriaceae]MDW5267100.1 VWA domain-containing protein [Edaphobacter sp.]
MPDEVAKAMPMRASTTVRKIFVVCCLGLFSCANAAAQGTPKPKGSPYEIQVTVKKVLVPVVVRDKQGHSVGDLKEEDFHVFDNGKPRPLSAFTIEKRIGTETATASNSENNALSRTPPQPATVYPRSIVFLFDDMHLSVQEMERAKTAGAALLAGSLTDSDIAAVVSISGRTNSGLTRDHAKLHDAIMSLKPELIYQTGNDDCPNITYYQADLMENKHNSTAEQDAVAQAFHCDPRITIGVAQSLAEGAARRALIMGHQDSQVALVNMRELVRRIATLPGRRMLILISPGFLTVESDVLTQESQLIDFAAQEDVTISALDARGIYTTALTASDDVHGAPILSASEFRAGSMRSVGNVMAELADGTGGNFFNNSNDLDAGFKGLTATPEYVYLLELPLDNIKPNGSYHRLKVKVDRSGVQVHARRGYILPKPMKKK